MTTETPHSERGYTGTERRADYSTMSKKVDDIHDALLGTYQEEGIVSKVKRHDNFIKGCNKFGWLFITAIIGSLVAGTFAVATSIAQGQGQCVQTLNTGK